MRCDALGVRILPFDDPDYPLAFSRIPGYAAGALLHRRPPLAQRAGAVGIVGSRKPTDYGLQAAADIGEALAKSGAIIVSGLADGLDSAGHRAAVKKLPHHRRCWACPSTAPTRPPMGAAAEDRAEGLRDQRVPARERAALAPMAFCSATGSSRRCPRRWLVVEAQEKSGTMSTVTHAERYGKPVFAVPGSIYSPNSAGTNGLLREGRAQRGLQARRPVRGAGPAGSAAPAAVTPQPDPMSDTERRVLACIGPQPLGVEELGVRSGLPTASCCWAP